jgi:mannose-6-phosphate isomerase
MNTPLRFVPHLRLLVWGGRRLGEVLGKPLPIPVAGAPGLCSAATCGESWEISDHAAHRSVVADGPRRGQTLRRLMEEERRALLGPAAEEHAVFPWLVKFLDAADWLSVQVHPPEEHVGRLWPGENSKTEAWFVLSAAPESRVYAGLLPGVDESRLRAALADGTVADCLHQFRPRAGDCVFLPAGTVHAVGGGVLFAEVQQTSDATFRLFDWNRTDARGRRRELHIEQALECINWKAGPVHPVRAAGYPDPEEPKPPSTLPVRQQLATCRYFVLEYVRDSESFAVGGSGRMQVLVVLHGRGELRTKDAGQLSLRPGDSLLLPADLEAVECRPQGSLGLLVSTLPRAARRPPPAPLAELRSTPASRPVRRRRAARR